MFKKLICLILKHKNTPGMSGGRFLENTFMACKLCQRCGAEYDKIQRDSFGRIKHMDESLKRQWRKEGLTF